MRIPVYRSKATRNVIAPGVQRRGTVRMNPTLMAQAELQKAAPLSEAFQGAAQFAKARYEASQEAQYNEAALAIEEGMREAARTFGKTADIYNVLDGDNNWSNSMQELRDATIGSISNRALQRKLSYSFEQAEIATRFRLRGEIDKRYLRANRLRLRLEWRKLVSVCQHPALKRQLITIMLRLEF